VQLNTSTLWHVPMRFQFSRRSYAALGIAIVLAILGLPSFGQNSESLKRPRNLSHPDLPHERMKFERLQQADSQGNIRPNALPTALRQLAEQRQVAMRSFRPIVAGVPIRAKTGVELATAGLEKAIWIPLGPNNIGGRTRSIVVHPSHPRSIWIGSVSGGVWFSEDGGLSFNPVDDFMSNLAISCLAMDPRDPDTIYAGTGEAFDNGDAIRGDGIFWTSNAKNWHQLASAQSHPEFRYINRLAVSKDGVLLVATQNGIIRSTDSDFRNDWTPTTLTQPIGYVGFDPYDPSMAIAGGLNGDGLVDAYYSIDGGKSWSRSRHTKPWNRRVELTYAKAPGQPHSRIVYASVDNNSGEIWRSTDGGMSFTKRDSKTSDGANAFFLGAPVGDPKYDQGDYANAIWAGDENDANLIIVGGLDLWRSDDGGNTLRPISTWWDESHTSAHADQHAIVSDPGYNGKTNKTVFFANDGGLFKTEDVLSLGNESQPPFKLGWINLNVRYGVTQFYGGAVNQRTGAIVGGAQDNGTLIFEPKTKSWSRGLEDGGGDGGWCAADNVQTFYGEYTYLNIHRSTDASKFSYISGQYWNDQKKNRDNSLGGWDWKQDKYTILDAKNENSSLFVAPFMLDPIDSNRLIAGGKSLWLTTDAQTRNTNTDGPTWRSIKNPVGPGDLDKISAIALTQASNSETIWVAYANGAVYRSTGGTKNNPSWSDRLNASEPAWPQRYVLALGIDPRNSAVAYATFGGYEKGNVWMTPDNGVHWQNIGQSLPEAPVRSLAVHPRNSKYLYIGTEVGLFASEDGGATWSPTNEGPTNCAVYQLFWLGETLIAVTHGRGMWQIDLSQ
jgi:photosystem II stability/assembly factor-like uncharacterized protein